MVNFRVFVHLPSNSSTWRLLHRAAAALNENNMDDTIPSKGDRTRLLMLIDALIHSSNHYGQMVEYLRMNNIVPPASR
jgi:hypothetical protein